MAVSQITPKEDEAKVAATAEPDKPADATNQQVRQVAKTEAEASGDKPASGEKAKLSGEDQEKLKQKAEDFLRKFGMNDLVGKPGEGGANASPFAAIAGMLSLVTGGKFSANDLVSGIENFFGMDSDEPKVAAADADKKPTATGDEKPAVVAGKPEGKPAVAAVEPVINTKPADPSAIDPGFAGPTKSADPSAIDPGFTGSPENAAEQKVTQSEPASVAPAQSTESPALTSLQSGADTVAQGDEPMLNELKASGKLPDDITIDIPKLASIVLQQPQNQASMSLGG